MSLSFLLFFLLRKVRITHLLSSPSTAEPVWKMHEFLFTPQNCDFLPGWSNYQVTWGGLMSSFHVQTFFVPLCLWIFNCLLAVLQGQVDLMAFQSDSIWLCRWKNYEFTYRTAFFSFFFLFIKSQDLAQGRFEVVLSAAFLYSSHVPVSLSLPCLLRWFLSFIISRFFFIMSYCRSVFFF